MTLDLAHFDTKTKQPLAINEQIDNCIAEYLFPEAKFKIGHMDPETVQVKDLEPHQGNSLQFSSGKRLYYSNEPVGKQLFPKPSDRAAYGSLPFTPVNKLLDLKQARVLVIDDETGNSGGVLHDKQFAKHLVGDCYGKMSYELAQQMTGKDNTPIQFRLGIRPQEGNDAYRIAKGTLAPDARLQGLGHRRNKGIRVDGNTDVIRDLNLGDYDLVLASSMFKGRKGEQAIAPGSYKLDLGLGLKTEAEYGRQKLGVQVLVNYPKGVEQDVLPKVRDDAQELRKSLRTPADLARAFIKYYEDKQDLKASLDAEEQHLMPIFNAFEEKSNQLSSEEALYKLLKTDLDNHGQLLEHPYVVEQLKGYVQSRWKELGFSGGLRIKSALAQPTNKLGEDEICAPNLPDGVEVVVTRSPLVNSNGVIVLQNKHIPELMSLQGSIHINPKTAAQHLQADFDGDRLAYERADKFPVLTAEIKEKLLPENRYTDIVKRDKVPYQGSFEQIAIQCADNQIGIIANQIMTSVAISNDTLSRPDEEKPKSLRQSASYYRKLLAAAEKQKVKLPEEYTTPMKEIIQVAKNKDLSSEQVEKGMAAIRSIQKQAVSDLGNELQVAADGPKSASRPDMKKFSIVQAVSNSVHVGFMRDRKDRDVFLERTANVTTYSPIDTLLREVNATFKESTLKIEPRPTHTFRDLFPNPGNDYINLAKEIQKQFNQKLKTAVELNDRLQNETERAQPHLLLPYKDSDIAITRLDLKDTSINTDQALNIVIMPTPSHLDIPNTQVAYALVDKEPKLLGAVSIQDSQELQIPNHKEMTQSDIKLVPGVTESTVEAAWRELNKYVGKIQSNFSDEEKMYLAQGMWHAAHSRTDHTAKKALAAFRIFPRECTAELYDLHCTQLSVVGLQYDTNKHKGQNLEGQTLPCEIVEQEIPSKNGPKTVRGIAVDGQFLGPIQQESHSFPVDTIFKAEFTPDPPAKVLVKLPDGTALSVGQVRDNTYNGTTFDGSKKKIHITPTQDDKGRPTFRVSLDDKTIGHLDLKSAKAYKEVLKTRNNVTGLTNTVEVEASIKSPPSNTGTLSVAPTSTRYPWQLEKYPINTTPENTKELQQLDRQRQLLRARYNNYTVKVTEFWGKKEGSELDKAVATMALLHREERSSVAAMLSQSPNLTSKRPPESSPQFEEYKQNAQTYVNKVCDVAQEQADRKRGIQR